MRATAGVLLGFGVLLVGCDGSSAGEPTGVLSSAFTTATVGDNGPIVTGSGSVLRNLGAGDELSTFAYNAVNQGNSVGGHFTYHFRAAEFSMLGRVTCATVVGNRAWIGGVIDQVHSADPADQAFVGTDVWWLVEDNGDGGSATADRTTSLLLTTVTTTITAASWCRDTPIVAVPLRSIVAGNIAIH